jgi:hypothetical protein
LDAKRLPNGSELVELVDKHGRRSYTPPFEYERLVHYDHNAESLKMLRNGNLEGAREACDTRESYIVLDRHGYIVCGKRTEQEAKDY